MKKILIVLMTILFFISCKKDNVVGCVSTAGSFTLIDGYLTAETGINSKPNTAFGGKFYLDNCESSSDKSNPKVTFISGGTGTYQYQLSSENDRKLIFSDITNVKDSAFVFLFSRSTFKIQETTDTTMKILSLDTSIKDFNGLKYKASAFTFKRTFP